MPENVCNLLPRFVYIPCWPLAFAVPGHGARLRACRRLHLAPRFAGIMEHVVGPMLVSLICMSRKMAVALRLAGCLSSQVLIDGGAVFIGASVKRLDDGWDSIVDADHADCGMALDWLIDPLGGNLKVCTTASFSTMDAGRPMFSLVVMLPLVGFHPLSWLNIDFGIRADDPSGEGRGCNFDADFPEVVVVCCNSFWGHCYFMLPSSSCKDV
ncbi:hypothetical protein Nepgr_033595 [Nepenthes gracilis]|uniref:Uncharacterized protein n=1 Tax=Nepenthes gracilis TaxID=150966 RepID=A0AAD3TM73_NEPGR|nr:hypothetical protein Nepgr_033595 [Nepenthes gracilis]